MILEKVRRKTVVRTDLDRGRATVRFISEEPTMPDRSDATVDPLDRGLAAAFGPASAARGVLETIAASIAPVPRVLLRDTAPGEPPGPILRPRSDDDDDPAIRYRIDGEIARGGMGSILKGRDPDLGRDVALKVLRDDYRDDADLVRRFVEEAQIGGQLQHPGVVPIYELGTLADRRPFFSMKLVKGHTLAQLLEARQGPTPTAPASWRSSRRSPRRWPTRTPAA
jgi:hypothetical protein